MSYRKNNKPQHLSVPISLATGLALAWTITLITAMVITVLISGDHIAENVIIPAAVMTVFAAAFLSALFIGAKWESNRMLMCLGNGLLYMVSMLCCNALVFDGRYQGIVGGLLTIISSSLVAGLLQSRQKRQRPSYAKRYRNS